MTGTIAAEKQAEGAQTVSRKDQAIKLRQGKPCVFFDKSFRLCAENVPNELRDGNSCSPGIFTNIWGAP